MASATFQSFERNMKRQFWMNFLDAQLDATRRNNFRASLINNPITGLPLDFASTAQAGANPSKIV
jgi:hypothetical protein